MMTSLISASIMCADLLNLEKNLEELHASGCDLLHVDVADGVFVPNYTLGTDLIRLLHDRSPIPLDIHLMVTEPLRKFDYFDFRPGDFVSFHAEAGSDPTECLRALKARGVRPGIALNPETPLTVLQNLWDSLEEVLIMAIHPGFAGQKMLPGALERLAEVRGLRDTQKSRALISIDGNVSFENAPRMAKAGAEIFVCGTSSVYGKEDTVPENFRKFRECIRTSSGGGIHKPA